MAQGPGEVPRAKYLFSSLSLRDRAWGAYLSGILHDASLNSLLIERFSDARRYSDAKPGTEEHAYVLALLDALIQSERPVPIELLLAFRQGWTDEVLILIARATNTEDALLALREQTLDNAQWLTVNNLLLSLHSSRFFVRTLLETPVTHTFTFRSRATGGGIGSGVGGGGAVDGTRQLPAEFPPIGLYQLVDFGHPGYVIVSTGPRDTFYRRTVVPTNGQAGWGVPVDRPDRGIERIAYLAAMTGSDASQVRAILSATTDLEWQAETDWAGRLDQELTAQTHSVQDLANTAELRGFTGLTGVELTIVTEIEDLRETRDVPLPVVAKRTFALR